MPDKPRSKFSRETDEDIFFEYVCECEDCEARGEIGLLKENGMQPFDCPEGCGATYVPWKYNGRWQLKCVVLPQYFPSGAGGRDAE